MDITLNVKIDITDRLEALLAYLTKPKGFGLAELKVETVKPKEIETPKPQSAQAPEKNETPKDEGRAKPLYVDPDGKEWHAYPTNEDLIEAMNAVRTRLQGEGWQTAAKTPLHQKLTAFFRKQLRDLCIENSLDENTKAAALPMAPVRVQFVRTLAEIELDESGEPTIPLPF